MQDITQVRISPKAYVYLEKRGLIQQYQKAKFFILAGHIASVDLKIRQPKEDKVWYFRINKQFRALCILENNILYITSINNHQ